MQGTSVIQKEGINHTKVFENVIVCLKKTHLLHKLGCLIKKVGFFTWYNQCETNVWLYWDGNLKSIKQKSQIDIALLFFF